MGLTSFLREAIDCYIADSEVAWSQIGSALSQIESEKGPSTIEEDRQAEATSEEITSQELRDRFLEQRNESREKAGKFEPTSRPLKSPYSSPI